MDRRRTPSLDVAVPDIFRRQLGVLPTRNFARRLGAPEDIVLRFETVKWLERHDGCVNTVSFSADGDILASGSDDTTVILWDWQAGEVEHRFHSGHVDNVFQAKFMPFSDNQSIVTSSADGEVRHAQILESGEVETVMVAQHEGGVHKLAIEPGSPHIFYSCGEDGLVQHCDLRIKDGRELFLCRQTNQGRSCRIIYLNAIAIDPRNPNLFAVAGSDAYARLFDLRNIKLDPSTDFGVPVDHFCPPHFLDRLNAEITGLAFSEQSELLISYNKEFIYCFDSTMGLGQDLPTESDQYYISESEMSETSYTGDVDQEANIPQVYMGHTNAETMKGVSFYGPNCEYVVSGSDCGRIFIWKKKGGQIIRVMEADNQVVNCIESHPHAAILASSGIDKGIKLWAPTALEKAKIPIDVLLKIVELLAPISQARDDDDDDSSTDEDDSCDEDEDDYGDVMDDCDGDDGDGDGDGDGDDDDDDDGEGNGNGDDIEKAC